MTTNERTSGSARTTGRSARAGIDKGRIVSLFWAVPFMVFLAFPVQGALSLGLGVPKARLLLAETIALGLVYVATWIFNDSAPADASGARRFLGFITVLVALQVAMGVTVDGAGGTGAVYMLCYALSPLAILSPPGWMLPATGLGLSLGIVESLIWPAEGPFPMVILTMTTIVCVLARLAMDRGRQKDVENAQNLALSRERERTRMSADLHDILGQTLTGITVKADLAGRLLDAGRLEEARVQIDDLTEMSRAALADVRDVVAANRMLLPETEIDSARAVLTAAGIRLEVVREGEPAPGTPSTFVAHVIREGCTNAYRHSAPTRVTVVLRGDGVSVVNDGAGLRGAALKRGLGASGPASPSAGGGTGLRGLRERIGARGALEWGREGGTWTLDLRLFEDGGAR